MSYNWNEHQLKREKRMAKRRKDKFSYQNLKVMLKEIDKNQKKLVINNDLSYSMTEIFSYDIAKYIYEDDLDLIPQNLKYISRNIHRLENNIDNVLEEQDCDILPITDENLIYLTKDLFNWLGDNNSIKLVDKILNKNNNYLNIRHNSKEFASSNAQNLYGMSFHNPSFKKNYINLFRRENIIDFSTLIHELMHVIFFEIYNNDGDIYFDELEGIYGEEIARLYLDEHNYIDEAYMINKHGFYNVLFDSLLLYIYNIAYNTSKNKKFRPDIVNEKIKNDLKYDLNLTKDILMEQSIYGFDTTKTVLNYSIIEDIMATSNSPQETFKRIQLLKENDNLDILNNLDKYGVTFHKDNLKNLKLLKKKF